MTKDSEGESARSAMKGSDSSSAVPADTSSHAQATSTTCSYYLSSYVLLRCFGILYMVAFLSMWVQIHGLIGSRGISPIASHLDNIQTAFSIPEAVLQYPAVFWLSSSDAALHVVCGLGTACGLALALDLLPALASFLCWTLYLSICVCGQEFTTHQADHLLLESGFLVLFLALSPSRVRGENRSWGDVLTPLNRNPFAVSQSTVVLWLLRFLLVRSNLMRGLQQLLGADPTWRNLVALTYGLESQPSPTLLAWYLHHFPRGVHQVLLFCILTIQIGVGVLSLGPRMFRRTAALYVALLHVFYILTGNYGTYHWNALLLCIVFYDDQLLPRISRFLRRILIRSTRRSLSSGKSGRVASDGEGAAEGDGSDGKPKRRKPARPSPFLSHSGAQVWYTRAALVLAAFVLVLSLVPISVVTHQFVPAPAAVVDAYRFAYRFKLVNIYGPFHRIHRERQELIVQSSKDAQHWHDFDNRYKPDSHLARPPAFVSPHISRVEHRLWQAAYADYQQEMWMSRLLHRLLERSKSVLSLFRYSEEATEAEYMRAVRYVYWFSEMSLDSSQTLYWNREFSDIFTPSFSQSLQRVSDRRQTMRHRLSMHGV